MSTGSNVDRAILTSGQVNSSSGGIRNARKPRNISNSGYRSFSSNCRNSSNRPSSSNNIDDKNSSNHSNSSDIAQSAYDVVGGKCIRYLESGDHSRECTAYVPPVVCSSGQSNAFKNEFCHASVLFATRVVSCREALAETWQRSRLQRVVEGIT